MTNGAKKITQYRKKFNEYHKKHIIIVFIIISASSCAYTMDKKWVLDGNYYLFENHQSDEARSAAIEEAEKRFPQTLHDCVAANDPEHLSDINQGREYRVSGWFVDQSKTDAVVKCMRSNGWLLVPKTLLAP